MEASPPPSPYKVSTITAVATLSTCIDLSLFFDHVQIGTADDIVFVGRGADGSVCTRGSRPARLKPKLRDVERFFDHQVTVIYSRSIPGADGVTCVQSINIKVFHNGNVQLTGVKSVEGGLRAVEFVAAAVTLIASFCPAVLPLGLENAPPKAANFRACLINSDFHAGYALRRDCLYRLISGPGYLIRCVFETYYPGVKVQFMWSSQKQGDQNGICSCTSSCSGKGDGGGCRKITMSVFQSGCCIITGAHTYEQLDDAHAFLARVFVLHKSHLARSSVTPTELKVATRPQNTKCPSHTSSSFSKLSC